MSRIDTAISIVNLLNLAAPGIAELILLIRRKDGGVAILPLLNEADAAFSDNIKKALDWQAANPEPTS